MLWLYLNCVNSLVFFVLIFFSQKCWLICFVCLGRGDEGSPDSSVGRALDFRFRYPVIESDVVVRLSPYQPDPWVSVSPAKVKFLLSQCQWGSTISVTLPDQHQSLPEIPENSDAYRVWMEVHPDTKHRSLLNS